jgi:CubicO group peptidase (beta-lactamase class C family)
LSSSFGALVQRRLDEIAGERRIPGAVVAFFDGEEVNEFATGVLNVSTGVEATPDSLFQIGSITKVFTTTLAMQLVDDGSLKLDASLRPALPELRLSDESVADSVTLRHLLSHTSGIDGDYFGDFGRGDDAIERYVASCSKLPQLFAPGDMFSYCNAGFVIIGRLIEVLTGHPYREVLRTKLVDRLGLRTPLVLPEEAIVHRVAAGHRRGDNGDPELAQPWAMPYSETPAGATPMAKARDLLVFARMHLNQGRGPDGRSVLSAGSAAAMRERVIDIPSVRAADEGWGLGWYLDLWDGHRVFGHDGSTLGQRASLRVVPEAGIAVVVLTNAETSGPLFDEVFEVIFGELAGIDVPPSPRPPEDPPVVHDVTRYAGIYQRHGVRYEIAEHDGGLTLAHQLTGELADLGERGQAPTPLIATDNDVFFVHDEQTDEPSPVFFLGSIEGRAGYLFDYRVTPRVV